MKGITRRGFVRIAGGATLENGRVAVNVSLGSLRLGHYSASLKKRFHVFGQSKLHASFRLLGRTRSKLL
jgi:hypothetical protein